METLSNWLLDNIPFYFVQFAELFIFFYGVMIMTAYIVTSFFSLEEVKSYKEESDAMEFDSLLSSPPLLPPLSPSLLLPTTKA